MFIEDNITTLRGNLMLIGDLNIHMDDITHPGTVTFTDFLDSLGLVNHTKFPTHVSGHTPDLIITQEDSNDILIVARGHMLLDHHFIDVKLQSASETGEHKMVTYRKLKNISPQDFSNNVGNTLGKLDLEAMDLYQAVETCNNSLKLVLNKHAPVKSRIVKVMHKQPWFDDKIKSEIILRRKKEQDWITNPSPYTLNAFYVQRRHVSNIIKMARQTFYMNYIAEHKLDTKSIYAMSFKLLGKVIDNPLPKHDSKLDLANEFNNSFKDKIDTIMMDLKPSDDNQSDQKYIESHKTTDVEFEEFSLVAEDTIKAIVRSAPSKSCELDPYQYLYLKKHLDVITSALRDLVNNSIKSGIMSTNLKEALLQPLLKKVGLMLIPKNFRPVSNLTYLSKLIE